MEKIKIAYIISHIDQALEFQWVGEQLSKEHFDLHFIFINKKESKLHNHFISNGFKSSEYIYTRKLDLLKLIFSIRKELKRKKIDIVHCHLFEASLVGLIAAFLSGIKKRIYTRHHSTYHRDYAPKAVKFDKFINKIASKIVSISPVVTKVLVELENVPSKKIIQIEHGLNLEQFSPSTSSDIERIKSKYNLQNCETIIGVISRFEKWKGVEYIFDAFSQFIKQHPTAKIVFANSSGGDNHSEIMRLIHQLPADSYVLVAFESEINTLYDCFDIFVHTPIDELSEAFGQIYIEALFKKIPTIATQSGIGCELLTAAYPYLVNYKDSDAIFEKLEQIHTFGVDEKVVEQLHNQVASYFTFDRKLKQLSELYIELNHNGRAK